LTPKVLTIEDLALRLTGRNAIVTNRHWDNTQPDWACPCCKRTKLHLTKPINAGLHGALVDHHDHLADYADMQLKTLVTASGRMEISEDEGWFKNHKIKPFIVRFQRSLICEDCNNADPAAKKVIGDICPFFSFTPEEISYFIKPEKHSPHKLDLERVEEVYVSANESYAYRKSLCDTLMSRLVTNSRYWGDKNKSPGSIHYETAKKIRSGQEDTIEDLTELFKTDPNIGPKLISDTLNLFEARAHEGSSTALSIKEQKRAHKQRLKLEREQMKSAQGFFNHNEPWLQSDIETLKLDYLQNLGLDFLSKKYGRTLGSLKAKLKTLGFEIP
jgi:hypothetical protein